MALPVLHLTSPYMRDGFGRLKGSTYVRDYQYLLNGNNKNARNHRKPFGDFFKGKPDGIYGGLTASAVANAKYWLGYPQKNCTQYAGPKLFAYLKGTKKIPASFVERRKERLAKRDAIENFRAKAVSLANGQVGTKERPAGSNKTKYGLWYGLNGAPWCAIFVSWCYTKAGRPLHYSYCPAILDDARSSRNGLRLVTTPQTGDLVLFRFGSPQPGHVGLFVKRNRDGSISTIEGNTGSHSDDNGGEVQRRIRYPNQIMRYVRVR